MRLTKVNPGMYKTEDGTILISRRDGRSWSGTRGSYAFTEWTATLSKNVEPEMEAARAEKRPSNDAAYIIAKAPTLAKLRERLAKYLADRDAGTLGERHRYGISLDHRPVAR